MIGSYILLIELTQDRDIQIGKTKKISFKKGYYAYIGSALNGLEQRIDRHIRKHKKFHWHIDFLLKHGRIIEIFYKQSSDKEECKISNFLDDELQSIRNFGCSDCKCKSHLFYGDLTQIRGLLRKINMKIYSFNANT